MIFIVRVITNRGNPQRYNQDQEPVSRKSRNCSGAISGGIIPFVSSKQMRLEAHNFAVFLIFVPFSTYEKISFTA